MKEAFAVLSVALLILLVPAGVYANPIPVPAVMMTEEYTAEEPSPGLGIRGTTPANRLSQASTPSSLKPEVSTS